MACSKGLFRWQGFRFQNYRNLKWRKWFSKLEKSEIEMIIILIFKSKQELFSIADWHEYC